MLHELLCLFSYDEYMRYRNSISWLILFLAQMILLYCVYGDLFPFKEQLQLFQFTAQYAEATLKQAGGVALYLSEFLTQFYVVWWIGPVVTAFLLTGIVVVFCQVLKKINPHDNFPFIYLLPWLSLLLMHFDYDYSEQGTIAYLFVLLFLWLYVNLKAPQRMICGICMLPVLYGMAGPVVHLFAVSAVLFEFLTNGKMKYTSICYLFVAVMVAVVGSYWGYSNRLASAFLPDCYYLSALPHSAIYYSWYALLLALLLAAYLKRYTPPVSRKGKVLLESVQWLIMLFLAYEGTVHFGRLDTLDSIKQDGYLRNEQWSKAISDFDGAVLSKRRMCGLNLALAHQGQLADRLFDYPQRGIETLMLPWDQSVYTAQLHSDLYYCMGIISASQKFAFEAFVSSHPSGNPRMLKRLVETNLITGAYPVAEKYICILENTWHYKAWASSYRRFLFNDQAVEQDPVLASKRHCWEAEKEIPGRYTDPVSTLMHLVPACPQNKAGLQYLTSFLLLNKDLDTYRQFQEKVYRSPAWREMAECQQEAIVICSPNDPRFWLEHGVSLKIRNRAIAFMQKVQNISGPGQNPAAVLASEYGRTYWYYYMFNTAEK